MAMVLIQAGLSWGSIQAETVRLQMQVKKIMDLLHSPSTNSLDSFHKYGGGVWIRAEQLLSNSYGKEKLGVRVQHSPKF